MVFSFGNWVDAQLDEVQDSYLDSDTRNRKAMISRAIILRLSSILDYEDPEEDEVVEAPGSKVVLEESGQYRDPSQMFTGR